MAVQNMTTVGFHVLMYTPRLCKVFVYKASERKIKNEHTPE